MRPGEEQQANVLPLWGEHYRLLALSHGAGAAEVERAYAEALARLPRGRFARAMCWLRGRSAGDLARARETLLDPVLRERYDRNLRELERLPHFYMQ